MIIKVNCIKIQLQGFHRSYSRREDDEITGVCISDAKVAEKELLASQIDNFLTKFNIYFINNHMK